MQTSPCFPFAARALTSTPLYPLDMLVCPRTPRTHLETSPSAAIALHGHPMITIDPVHHLTCQHARNDHQDTMHNTPSLPMDASCPNDHLTVRPVTTPRSSSSL